MKLVPTFADRGCHVVSATDRNSRIFGFILTIFLICKPLLHTIEPLFYFWTWHHKANTIVAKKLLPVFLILKKCWL
jgi:hypothetical protein